MQSILYHYNSPTQIIKLELLGECGVEYEEQADLCPRHLFSKQYIEQTDAVAGRQYLLGNDDVLIAVVNPTEKMEYFYRNGDGDKLLFVHHRTGKIETLFGELFYKPGDYVVIPVGTVYRVLPDAG